ncbi:MAG: hypothetical protein CBB87_05020 [Micavibrio sp. TMED27]|nr:AMP-dependent synthetase [Micavibrio sp.]OUT91393.1 MAG: hypothetical protein CBB87_05020 [Micavibrio sp. TMED27]|tara:strand:+ start:6167 stop:7513 length:1347 start_codon:yes stop_codon:yes gene_type:complete
MLFEKIKNHAPEKIALKDTVRSITYGDLNLEVDARIDALYDVDVLAIALDNSVEWILWDLAAMKAGIPCVPLPPFFSEEQVYHSLHSSGVSHILSPEGLRETGTGVVGLLTEGTAKVTYTSGTTGTPKGVCLSKNAMLNVAKNIVDVLGEEFVGKHVCTLPLGVLLENVAGVYAGLMAGCTLHLPSLKSYGEHYAALYDVLKDRAANSVILVPEMLRTLMAQVVNKGPLPTLKYIAVGGSKIDPSLIMQARAMGLPVYEGYGLSECASVVALNTPYDDRAGSAGKPLPHIKTRIIDGEIYIKNNGFLGYVGETAPDTIHTGDLGDIDGDGFLSVTGRSKNVLITSYGRNISPEWVEAKLLAHADIAQAIVYGDGASELSALIVPAFAGANVKDAAISANSTLPDYARIKDFTFVPPFTLESGMLTGTGRPRRETILKHYKKEKAYGLL